MTELLLPGLLELWTRLVPRMVEARAWLGEFLQPPGDVEIHARDGGIITGILLVDRGHVIAMIGIRNRVPHRRDVRWPEDSASWDPWDGR